ncbi:UPF0158 family protein [Arthrobacter cavernae]|uniref:Uncharacterized protein n=1 Tax=Arthrobacter cavernae TaxID=2817681 RepID=A0A939HE96_9MICC|nr:UPF0158 family protein [Arthrobacter cavernae]MBO1269274.1 hypothetical protein [Arthrobacter cavernae]
MLPLDAVDLEELAMALEYQGDYDSFSWLDPKTGEIGFWSSDAAYGDDEAGADPDERGAIRIEPMESWEGYRDMESFIADVQDERARDPLLRAIAGKGAFRRFKDTLFEFPDLRQQWFDFHNSAMRRRAIEWLVNAGVVDEDEAKRALAA